MEGWTFSGNPSNTLETVEESYTGIETDGTYAVDMDASPGNMTLSQTMSGLEEGLHL